MSDVPRSTKRITGLPFETASVTAQGVDFSIRAEEK